MFYLFKSSAELLHIWVHGECLLAVCVMLPNHPDETLKPVLKIEKSKVWNGWIIIDACSKNKAIRLAVRLLSRSFGLNSALKSMQPCSSLSFR